MFYAIPMLSPIGKLNKTTSNNEKGHLLSNVSDSDSINPDVESDDLLTVGKLFFTSSGRDRSCSASVIDTSDGNTGITAAHCLYKGGVYSEKVIFCPGYDNGNPSALGKIPVIGLSVPKSYIESKDDDYAAIKFDYPSKLQLQTGSFGWGLTPPSPVSIAIFGYPYKGSITNCTNDAKHFCTWRGYATLESPFRNKPAWKVPLHIGSGASGGPWVMKNNLPNYLGYLIGVTDYHLGKTGQANEYAHALNFTLLRELINWP
ncbi:8465_t:CDS:1 [Gigaspora margarita]|uniref:8465_t:CDS:1 n=1 Tax=Gigaspora margarita TaxID=4874 RepID=A0ABN7WHK8_GIGMA|nr:8465_t:CDS:1 [Gigaspora margarita]